MFNNILYLSHLCYDLMMQWMHRQDTQFGQDVWKVYVQIFALPMNGASVVLAVLARVKISHT